LDLLLGLENRVITAEVFTGECRLEQALVKDKRTQPGTSPSSPNRTKESVSPEQMEQLVSA